MHARARDFALAAGAVAMLAFVWAWLTSGPLLLMGLNWDTASYIALYASGQGSWRDLPWNSHFALGPIYQLGHLLVLPLRGTYIDGARLVGALSFALAAGTVAFTSLRLCGWLGLLWGALYAGAWGAAILLLTVEDNVLYLPAVTGLLALSLLRMNKWRLQHSVAAGVLGAAGILVSWQAGLYLCAPLYVALVHGGSDRSARTRARDAAIVIVTVVATLHVYLLTFWLASGGMTPLSMLWHTLFSRPRPSFFPETWRDVLVLLAHPRQVLRHVGLGFMGVFGPDVTGSRWLQDALPLVGLGVLIMLVSALVLSTLRARKTGRWHAQVVLVFALAVLAPTALYVDLPIDKYKRYEFLPLMACLWGAAATPQFIGLPRVRRLAGLALGTAAMLQFVLAAMWAREYRAHMSQRQPGGYHGKNGMPWSMYFRSLREAHPQACRFTFALDENLAHGRYQLEIPAGLWSELPDHLIVGDPAQTRSWPRQVKIVAPQDLSAPADCDWTVR